MSDTSTLIAIKYKGQMIEIPEGLTQNDISTFITSNDVSIYCTSTYANSTFAKISYISLSDYDNLQVKDPSTLYIIPS